jgi:hypothetical protein
MKNEQASTDSEQTEIPTVYTDTQKGHTCMFEERRDVLCAEPAHWYCRSNHEWLCTGHSCARCQYID